MRAAMVEEVGVDGEGEDEGTWPVHNVTNFK